LKTDYAFEYSFLLLLRGEFERGWPLYEGRWNAARFCLAEAKLPPADVGRTTAGWPARADPRRARLR